ncbi:MAG: hypothetical protein WC365_00015 [Candidatus Babeliales bacterium]|jgi:ankyrin repeat protein
MKNAKISLFLMLFNVIATFISAQSPKPLDLIAACKNLDAEMAESLLNKGVNPNLSNTLGETLRTIIDQHEEPKEPPTSFDISTFPKTNDIKQILDALIRHGANPLIHKTENTKLVDRLIQAWTTTHYIFAQNPIGIALRTILPVFLVYEVSQPTSDDTKLITTCLQSIDALYKQFPQKNIFDPLNKPLVKDGANILGKTPVLLAAENGHAVCLKEMLTLKDIANAPRVSFVTAHNALKSAHDKKTGLSLWGKASCKDILEQFLQTHFTIHKKYHNTIIQTTQSTIARMAWQQKRLETDTYDSAITEAMNTYAQRRLRKD